MYAYIAITCRNLVKIMSIAIRITSNNNKITSAYAINDNLIFM